jgi:hypothetical protein
VEREEAAMARVQEVSREELIARRERILRRLGVSYDDLLSRAEAGALVGEEYEMLDYLRDIAYLLGDE